MHSQPHIRFNKFVDDVVWYINVINVQVSYQEQLNNHWLLQEVHKFTGSNMKEN